MKRQYEDEDQDQKPPGVSTNTLRAKAKEEPNDNENLPFPCKAIELLHSFEYKEFLALMNQDVYIQSVNLNKPDEEFIPGSTLLQQAVSNDAVEDNLDSDILGWEDYDVVSKIVKTIVHKGADVNGFGIDQESLFNQRHFTCTPLYMSIKHGRPLATEALLEVGARVTDLNNDQATALHALARGDSRRWDNNPSRMIQHFVEKFPFLRDQMEFPDADGNTPLLFAAINQRQRTVKALIDLGCDKMVQNHKGETFLMMMIGQYKWDDNDVHDIVKHIGPSPLYEVQDLEGKNVLFRCCTSFLYELFIEEMGMDINSLDYEGKSVLLYCPLYLVPRLIEMGADMSIENLNSQTMIECEYHCQVKIQTKYPHSLTGWPRLKCLIDNSPVNEYYNTNNWLPCHYIARSEVTDPEYTLKHVTVENCLTETLDGYNCLILLVLSDPYGQRLEEQTTVLFCLIKGIVGNRGLPFVYDKYT